MINSKSIKLVVIVVICLALTFAMVLSVGKESLFNKQTNPAYAEELFGVDIISIEILADETQWQEMLDNAINEEYIPVDVIVNGTKFEKVGIRPKGNSSLSQVANSDSDRYSFRLKFDKYIKDQTCFGLNTFVVNNMISDNTYMKEYISYDILRSAGVDTPYFSFADVKVNGDNLGFYLAVELYGDSYKQRVSDSTDGNLYNVKSMDMGKIQNDGKKPDFQEKADFQEKPEGLDVPNNPKSNRNTGGSLEYIDDEPSSYSSIFENIVGKGTDSDYLKVIEALKALSENRDLEKYYDIDKILRYLAAHTVVVNLDSYSSSMAQNYYIYEQEGKITILPWDYNMAFGGFQCNDGSTVVNFPIDTPVSGVEMSSRPLINNLLQNEQYFNKYHEYLQIIITEYFADGKFTKKVQELNALISPYVKKDSTAFCTYEEYTKAVDAFIVLGELRGKSIQGQLDGSVPSTSEAQQENPEKLISADSLIFSDLGQNMMGGGKFPGEPPNIGNPGEPPNIRNGENNGKNTNL